jgi:hypothetical protein
MEEQSPGENQPAPPSASPADRRQHLRKSVVWGGRLRLDDGDTLECAVLDFSAGGAKILVEPVPSIGTRVTLLSPRIGAHTARVAWVAPKQVGIQFIRLADPVI